jgi:hypothetical protein
MRSWLLLVVCSLVSVAHAERLRDGPLRPPMAHPRATNAAPTKASSFAPRPGNRRHVYGAPIQAPILSNIVPVRRALAPR